MAKPPTKCLPPPAIFSRQTSNQILALNAQKQSCSSESDRSISSEVFGGSDMQKLELERQGRVRQRQVTANRTSLTRQQHERGSGDESSTLSKCRNKKMMHSNNNSSQASSSVRSCSDSKVTASLTQEQHVHHEDDDKFTQLNKALKVLEDKIWYLHTTEELFKIEEIKSQLEALSVERRAHVPGGDGRGERDDSVISSPASLSISASSTSRRSGQRSYGISDDVSCVSSLSDHTPIRASGVQTSNRLIHGGGKGEAKENIKVSTYNVRSLKAKKIARPVSNIAAAGRGNPPEPGAFGTAAFGTHGAGSFPANKRPFLANKSAPIGRKDKTSVPCATKDANNSLHPIVESNTTLLSNISSENDISQKFLLTREVDSLIANVEEEIQMLQAKQLKAKSIIRNTLTMVDEKEKELVSTEMELAQVYEEAEIVIRDRLREEDVVRRFMSHSHPADDELGEEGGDKTPSELLLEIHNLRRLSVDDLENAHTLKKESTYDAALYEERFKRRDRGYVPRNRTLNNPDEVLRNFERIDYLWNKLRSHAWEVGARQVFFKNLL